MSMRKSPRPVKTMRDKFAQATRGALIDEARKLFGSQGYEGTSLDTVASSAKATKGAVYHHFKDKTELFAAVYEELAKELTERVRQRAGTKPAGQIDRAISAFLEETTKAEMSRVLLQDGPAVLGEKCRLIDARYGLGLLVGLLEQSGDPRLVKGVGALLMAKVTLAMVIEGGQAIGAAANPREERRRVDRLMRHVFSSLTRK